MDNPVPPTAAARDRVRVLLTVLALFSCAFAVRLLFLHATPDAAWPYSAYYKGDAPVWLEYARALRSGATFEAGLPLRPPGMAYLVALAGPDRTAFLNVLWCALGAGVPVPFYLAARKGFGEAVGLVAGAGTAVSTGLLLLSTSLNNETPYLLLAGGSLFALEAARRSPGVRSLLAWSVLGALACLVRVEHVLFHLLGTIFLVATWGRSLSRNAWIRRCAILGLGFALPLVPWHVHAWTSIERFNRNRQDLGESFEAVVEGVASLGAGVPLDPDAEREAAALPAYGRPYWKAFVIGTVVHRGRTRVTGEDFRILEEAFGARPEPLRRFPFVTLYGALNFFLAQNPLAAPGFSREALDRPPPLDGGEYPPRLVSGLPPEDGLSFAYPPHVAAFNHGYGMGLAWILENPGAFLSLSGRRLVRFWEGAALGATGYGAPLGLEGMRRRVDLLVPRRGAPALAWRLAVLGAFLAGLAAAGRRAALLPWLLFLASRLAAAVLFFGYARIGATAIPVVAMGVAFVVTRWIPPASRLRAATLLAALLLAGGVAAEAIRYASPPTLTINGRRVGETDPYPAGLYIDMPVAVRF